MDETESKEGGGRTLTPPQFQLTSQPIQRQVVDEEDKPVTIDDVWKYIDKNDIPLKCLNYEVEGIFDQAMKLEIDLSIADFVKNWLQKPTKKKEVHEEACDEEKKGNKVSRTTAPKWVRDTVYETSKTNNKHYNGINKSGNHSFNCGICNQELAIDQNGKEVGYESPNSKTKKQPPVCHGKAFPAAYVNYAIAEIIEDEGYDSTQLKHCSETNAMVQWLIWAVGLDEMFPGHLKCNSVDKDEEWRSLGSTVKDKVKKNVRKYLENNVSKESKNSNKGKKRMIGSVNLLQEMCQMLDDFSKKSSKKDDDDEEGGSDDFSTNISSSKSLILSKD